MNYLQAEELLGQWTSLLNEVAELELHCDLSEDAIRSQLDRRQRIIGELQQLDASVREIQRLLTEQWSNIDTSRIDNLIKEGKKTAEKILLNDSQLVENASKKRSEVLSGLKKTSLAKGYMPSSRQLKIRPPVIVDRNA